MYIVDAAFGGGVVTVRGPHLISLHLRCGCAFCLSVVEVLQHRTRFHTVTLFLRANLHVGRKLHFQKAVTECRFRNPAGAGLHPLSRLK